EPGGGIEPMLRAANEIDRLTRLPQVATSSSLLRRTNSLQVKSVSWFSGPAPPPRNRTAPTFYRARRSRPRMTTEREEENLRPSIVRYSLETTSEGRFSAPSEPCVPPLLPLPL